MAARHKWDGSEADTILRRMRADGCTSNEIATALGRSLNSVENRLRVIKVGGLPRPVTDAHSSLESPIPQWLDELRPIAMPAPEPARAITTANAYTLVIGDQHFPQQCEQTESIFLDVVAQLRPARVILNGDTVDLLAVSKYPKDQRFTWTLREEVTAFHGFLHRLMSIGNAWGLRVLETEANHSGNGTASRWHRYLSDRVPALYAHPDAQTKLGYQEWFYPTWCPITLVESVVVADDLLVLHGDIVRKHAAYSARAHGEKWHSSIMHSHTHRSGSGIERIPGVGSRSEAVRRVYEIGCGCRLDPSYASVPNWTNGFAIISHDDDTGHYGVEQVTVTRGAAAVSTLGSTVRAAA